MNIKNTKFIKFCIFILISLVIHSCSFPDLTKHFQKELLKRFLIDTLRKNTNQKDIFEEPIGELDPEFNGTGIVTIDIGSTSEKAHTLALQPDGKIIVAGHSNYNFAIIRLNPDGTIDNSFGINGIVTIDIGGSDEAYDIALQSNGKIIVGGYSTGDFAVIRLNPDGTLDSSFDYDGKTTTNITTYGSGTPTLDFAYGIVLQPNLPDEENIFLSGYAISGTIGSPYTFSVVKYKSSGQLDTSFDTDGIVTTPGGASYSNFRNTIEQQEGKIITAGTYDYNFFLARYESNTGVLDSSFGTMGVVSIDVGGNDVANALALQPDGKIIVAGEYENGGNRDFAIVRLNSNGSKDNSFGSNGIVLKDIGGISDSAQSLILQPNGKIIIAGSSNANGSFDFSIIRYGSDGILDTSFGNNGIVLTPIGTSSDICRALTLQPNGRIIIAGDYDAGSGNYNLAIARYR